MLTPVIAIRQCCHQILLHLLPQQREEGGISRTRSVALAVRTGRGKARISGHCDDVRDRSGLQRFVEPEGEEDVRRFGEAVLGEGIVVRSLTWVISEQLLSSHQASSSAPCCYKLRAVLLKRQNIQRRRKRQHVGSTARG